MERMTRQNDKELEAAYGYLMRNMHPGSVEALYREIEELKNQMADGFCHFSFTKVSGEHREAYGTRASDIIDRYGGVSGKGNGRPPAFNGTFPYFDMEKKDWRCFRIDTLAGVDMEYVV